MKDQVAEILDCPPGTVKSLTARGLADLRAQLGNVLESPIEPLQNGGVQ